MSEIVDIEDFRVRQLAKAELEFNLYMDRADAFRREGKTKFSDEMIAKAKEVRKTIDRLRKSGRKPLPKPPVTQSAPVIERKTITMFNFDGSEVEIDITPKHPHNPFTYPAPENN